MVALSGLWHGFMAVGRGLSSGGFWWLVGSRNIFVVYEGLLEYQIVVDSNEGLRLRARWRGYLCNMCCSVSTMNVRQQ